MEPDLEDYIKAEIKAAREEVLELVCTAIDEYIVLARAMLKITGSAGEHIRALGSVRQEIRQAYQERFHEQGD